MSDFSKKLIMKQDKDLAKNPLQNIIYTSPYKDIFKKEITFYYYKKNSGDEFPYFYPDKVTGIIKISGNLYLDEFPLLPPSFILKEDFTHTHVISRKLCFSLDANMQNYFENSSFPRSCLWTQAVTIRQFLKSVYQFLAEDDEEYGIINNDVKKSTFKGIEKDNLLLSGVVLPYNEVMEKFYKNDTYIAPDTMPKEFEIQKKYDIKRQIPKSIVEAIDYITKMPILSSGDLIVYPLFFEKKGRQYQFTPVGFDPMAYSTYKSLINNQSNSILPKSFLGESFNYVLPWVGCSEFYNKNKKDYNNILVDLADKTFKKINKNPILWRKGMSKVASTDDLILYIIGNSFMNLAIRVFKGNKFPAEEVLKGFLYLHHLGLMCGKVSKGFFENNKNLLDKFNTSRSSRHKSHCPNLGVLIAQLLFIKDDKKYIKNIIEEMFARNVMWSIGYDTVKMMIIGKGKYQIRDNYMDDWIDETWKNSHAGLQFTAFQYEYNRRFSGETLKTLDMRFGTINDQEIQIFQGIVKNINKWTKLKGAHGYQAFYEFFGLKFSTEILKKDLAKAFKQSWCCGYNQSKKDLFV